MFATDILRGQHRHIEQRLVILEAQDDCAKEFAELVVELNVHLAAEESVFYPDAEQALGRTLEESRCRHGHVGRAVVRAARASGKRAFPRRLLELTEAFKAHARTEERVVHPSLEGVLGAKRLDALGAALAAFHSDRLGK